MEVNWVSFNIYGSSKDKQSQLILTTFGTHKLTSCSDDSMSSTSSGFSTNLSVTNNTFTWESATAPALFSFVFDEGGICDWIHFASQEKIRESSVSQKNEIGSL